MPVHFARLLQIPRFCLKEVVGGASGTLLKEHNDPGCSALRQANKLASMAVKLPVNMF